VSAVFCLLGNCLATPPLKVEIQVQLQVLTAQTWR